MNYLLDTNVISELTSKQPDRRVTTWIDSVDDMRLFLSVIAVGEIQRGIYQLPDSPKRRELVAWLMDQLLIRFDGRILPLTTSVMLTWGRLTARGRTLPAVDSMVAALALDGQLCLVTRNTKDFAGTGVTLFNPWKDPPAEKPS